MAGDFFNSLKSLSEQAKENVNSTKSNATKLNIPSNQFNDGSSKVYDLQSSAVTLPDFNDTQFSKDLQQNSKSNLNYGLDDDYLLKNQYEIPNAENQYNENLKKVEDIYGTQNQDRVSRQPGMDDQSYIDALNEANRNLIENNKDLFGGKEQQQNERPLTFDEVAQMEGINDDDLVKFIGGTDDEAFNAFRDVIGKSDLKNFYGYEGDQYGQINWDTATDDELRNYLNAMRNDMGSLTNYDDNGTLASIGNRQVSIEDIMSGNDIAGNDMYQNALLMESILSRMDEQDLSKFAVDNMLGNNSVGQVAGLIDKDGNVVDNNDPNQYRRIADAMAAYGAMQKASNGDAITGFSDQDLLNRLNDYTNSNFDLSTEYNGLTDLEAFRQGSNQASDRARMDNVAINAGNGDYLLGNTSNEIPTAAEIKRRIDSGEASIGDFDQYELQQIIDAQKAVEDNEKLKESSAIKSSDILKNISAADLSKAFTEKNADVLLPLMAASGNLDAIYKRS